MIVDFGLQLNYIIKQPLGDCICLGIKECGSYAAQCWKWIEIIVFFLKNEGVWNISYSRIKSDASDLRTRTRIKRGKLKWRTTI